MSAAPSLLPPLDVIAARLRAAGCIFAEDEAQLLLSAVSTPRELAALVDQRVAGVPIEHVLGWTEFCGMRVAMDPGVFVPRPRTELLVREAAALARRAVRAHQAFSGPSAVLVDLCCGSGALAAAVAAEVEGLELHASDIDRAAVRCARRNLAAAGGQVHEGDLFAPLPRALRGHVDVLIANVPYVPTDAIQLLPVEARTHEPRVSLDGGADGLDVLRRVTAAAPRWLAPGGHLLMETSQRQAAGAVEIVDRHGLVARVARSDEDDATVIIAVHPSVPGPGR